MARMMTLADKDNLSAAIESGDIVWHVKGGWGLSYGGRGWVVATTADDARRVYLGIGGAGRRLFGDFSDSAGHKCRAPIRQTTMPLITTVQMPSGAYESC